MKNQFFTIAALSLSLLVFPSWAMDGDDDNDSSSSSSSDSQLESGQVEDVKGKTFYLHIANPEAAKFYQKLAEKYKLSIPAWKRESAQSGNPSHIEEQFRSTKGTQKLCTRMRKALKKFGAAQSLSFAFGRERNGLVVELTTGQEQSAKELAAYCQKSEYIYRVFADKEAFEKHIQTHSLAKACAILERSFGSALAEQFKEMQLSDNSERNGDVSDGSEDGGESDGSN